MPTFCARRVASVRRKLLVRKSSRALLFAKPFTRFFSRFHPSLLLFFLSALGVQVGVKLTDWCGTDDYTSREAPKQVNGVEVLAAAPAAALGELAGQYKKCSECKHLLHHCHCPGQPGMVGPRRFRPPPGAAGASNAGGFQSEREAALGQLADASAAAAAAGKARNGNAEAQDSSSGSDSEGTSEAWPDSINDSERVDPGAASSGASQLPLAAVRRVRAWAEFAADPDTLVQLALAEGDVIHVLQEANEDGWGYGINQAGQEGYFPVTHVEVLSPSPRTSSLLQAATSGARAEGTGTEAGDVPSPQMLEPMVAGQHRCDPSNMLMDRGAHRGVDSSAEATDQVMLQAHLQQAEQRIKAAQEQWEADLKRRTPNAPEVADAGGSTKNFFNYMIGKPAPAQQPVQNFVPLDIRHIGAAVPLPGASEAAAQARMASQNQSSSAYGPKNTGVDALAQPGKPGPSSAASQYSSSPPDRPQPPPPPPPAEAGGLPRQHTTQPWSNPPSGGMDGRKVGQEDEWVCATCTLRNAACHTACDACGAYKGTGRSETTVSEQEQRLCEQQAMSQRLKGLAPHAAPGQPSSCMPGTQLPPAPHNTVVMPPVVAMHQAPSPPKGDSADSPGARAMMMAGPCTSRPSPPSPAGGENQQIKNMLARNLAQLSPGTGGAPASKGAGSWSDALGLSSLGVSVTASAGHHVLPSQQQQEGQGKGKGLQQAQHPQQPQSRPPSATKKPPPPPPPREQKKTALGQSGSGPCLASGAQQRPGPPPPPAKPNVPPPPIPVAASEPRKNARSAFLFLACPPHSKQDRYPRLLLFTCDVRAGKPNKPLPPPPKTFKS